MGGMVTWALHRPHRITLAPKALSSAFFCLSRQRFSLLCFLPIYPPLSLMDAVNYHEGPKTHVPARGPTIVAGTAISGARKYFFQAGRAGGFPYGAMIVFVLIAGMSNITFLTLRSISGFNGQKIPPHKRKFAHL